MCRMLSFFQKAYVICTGFIYTAISSLVNFFITEKAVDRMSEILEKSKLNHDLGLKIYAELEKLNIKLDGVIKTLNEQEDKLSDLESDLAFQNACLTKFAEVLDGKQPSVNLLDSPAKTNLLNKLVRMALRTAFNKDNSAKTEALINGISTDGELAKIISECVDLVLSTTC